MNKLTKIGVSALCGSLASVTYANAGTLSVAGGATATWANNETETTGNPIGLSSGMTFTGTGELDNGTTFTLSLTNTDQAAYSAGNISIVTPGMGTFVIDQGAGGGGIDRYDDKMPTAWEETTGTATGTGLRTVGGVTGAAHIDWAVPADMLPDGLSAYIAYTPRAQGLGANDKATSGSSSEQLGSGYDIALEYTGFADGLSVFGGLSNIEANGTAMSDAQQVVLGATYAVGMVTVGYQYSLDEKNGTDSATNFYENQAYGISFAVNDDLSVSYGEHKSDRSVTTGATADVENTAKSLQLSYTVGGLSLKIAETSTDNANYTSGTTKDLDGTTVALSLAF
jgi:outer membrane protein OmpU